MKNYLLTIAFVFSLFAVRANISKHHLSATALVLSDDSVKLMVDGKNAYYQKMVKTDSIPESLIYVRAVQFMASKNFQLNYGNQEEGKIICTTIQDLNINPVYVGDESDVVQPYTATFSIALDLKNGRYRYTIYNVIIFRPDENGNKRQTLYDVYQKATNTNSRRIAKDSKKVIESFERYLDSLTDDLYEGIKQKSAIYSHF